MVRSLLSGIRPNAFAICVISAVLLNVAVVETAVGHNDPNAEGNHNEGYHLHAWDYPNNVEVILSCKTVLECHEEQAQWLLNTDPGYGGCAGQGVQKNDTLGPNKYYSSHWWIRTLAQCDDGNGGYGTNMAFNYHWYIDSIPEECEHGDSAPVCPGWVAEEVPEAPKLCNESNPCNPANGLKTQLENDFTAGAIGGLVLDRYYSSKGPYRSGSMMAPGWRHTYSRSIDELPDRRTPLLLPSSSSVSGSPFT